MCSRSLRTFVGQASKQIPELSCGSTTHCCVSKRGGGGCTRVMHGRSGTTIDLGTHKMPGRSTSSRLHRPYARWVGSMVISILPVQCSSAQQGQHEVLLKPVTSCLIASQVPRPGYKRRVPGTFARLRRWVVYSRCIAFVCVHLCCA